MTISMQEIAISSRARSLTTALARRSARRHFRTLASWLLRRDRCSPAKATHLQLGSAPRARGTSWLWPRRVPSPRFGSPPPQAAMFRRAADHLLDAQRAPSVLDRLLDSRIRRPKVRLEVGEALALAQVRRRTETLTGCPRGVCHPRVARRGCGTQEGRRSRWRW